MGDPGATINTLGAIVEMTASSSHDYDYILVMIGNRGNSSMTTHGQLLEVLTGAASSEVLLATIAYVPSAQEFVGSCLVMLAPYGPIASGTRISVRSQATINDATDRLLDVVIIGMAATAPAGGAGGLLTHPGMQGGMRG